MRVLLLGVADSLWMKRYVEWVLDGASFDVLLEDADASRYADWYRGEGVGSLSFRSAAESGPSSKLATFRSFFREVREAADRIIEIDGLECAHLHFLDMRNLLLALALKRRNPNLRIVASFWGSDLLRARAAERLIMSWSLRVCDAVTIQDRESMLMPFHGRFGTRFDEKLFPVLFPGENNALQGIAEKESRAESCEMLSIPADKQVVAIGYNANPNHQHVTVLNQLSRMPEDCRQRMHILLPMTYPSISDGYRAELMAALEGLGSTSTIIEGFQSDEAIARIHVVAHFDSEAIGGNLISVRGVNSEGYQGLVTTNFTIKPADIKGASPAIPNSTVSAVAANGVKVNATFNGTPLVEGDDFTVTFNPSPVSAARQYVATVTGKGNFTNSALVPFTVTEDNTATSIDKLDITIAPVTYTGKGVMPAVTVKDGEKTLVKGIDYTVEYKNNVNACAQYADNPPIATVTMIGEGYSGSKDLPFTIAKATITRADIDDIEYTGSTVTPTAKVYAGTLQLGSSDFTINKANSSDSWRTAGNYTVAVSAAASPNFQGTLSNQTLRITPVDLGDTSKVTATAMKVNNAADTPVITLSATLAAVGEYTLVAADYSDRKSVV